jgi:hypothetical protein
VNLSPELESIIALLADIAGLPAGRKAARSLDWTRWLSMVDEHKLGPLLGAHVPRRPGWNLPDFVQHELAHRFNRSSFAAMVRQTQFVRIMRQLQSAGIQAAVLKGAALAPGLYEVAAERLMWDIDLLFADAATVERAAGLLRDQGYRPKKQFEGHHHAPPLVNPVNELAFELHTNLITPPVPPDVVADLWARRTRRRVGTDLDITVPDPVGLLAHQCIHALNDPVRSPLLRNLFEIAWLIQRMEGSTRDAFVRWVRHWKLEALVSRATRLASELFGTPSLLSLPSLGAYTLWCRSRLEWCDYGKWWARLKRHLASTHVERLLSGSHDRNVFTLVEIVARSARDAAWHRLRPRLAWSVARPRRPGWPHAEMDGTVLIHDDSSGEVHLLNELAARIWLAADGTSTLRELATRLADRNVSPRAVRDATNTLVGRGLLVSE